ncbi:plasmid stabilization protein [Flavobacterium aquidurense]|nr:plasmid stabilization protein [Flavobacterium aquidurense]
MVSPIALKNIEEAVEYYILKATKKVALEFLNDYKSTYKALIVNPFYQFHDNNYPFFIVDELSKTVFLNAIFHNFQHPEKYPTK